LKEYLYKKSPILLLICLAMVSCNSKKSRFTNDLVMNGIHGPVKELLDSEFSASLQLGEVKSGALNSITKWRYNPDGFITNQLMYDGNGTLRDSVKTIFNNDGYPVQLIDFSPDGDTVNILRIGYDSANIPASEEMLNRSGNLKLKYHFNFSPDGRLLDETTFDSSGQFQGVASVNIDTTAKTVYSTDSLKVDSAVAPWGYIVTKITLHYSFVDKYGNWTDGITKDADGNPINIDRRYFTYY
jgi:hypothetical protein